MIAVQPVGHVPGQVSLSGPDSLSLSLSIPLFLGMCVVCLCGCVCVHVCIQAMRAGLYIQFSRRNTLRICKMDQRQATRGLRRSRDENTKAYEETRESLVPSREEASRLLPEACLTRRRAAFLFGGGAEERVLTSRRDLQTAIVTSGEVRTYLLTCEAWKRENAH